MNKILLVVAGIFIPVFIVFGFGPTAEAATLETCPDGYEATIAPGGSFADACKNHQTGGPASDSSEPASAANCTKNATFLGILPAWYKYLNVRQVGGNCEIVLATRDGETDWQKTAISIVFALIDMATRLAGLVAVIFVIVGGFTFITSNGQPEKAKNARNTILNALVGVVIAIVAATVVNIVGKAFIS